MDNHPFMDQNEQDARKAIEEFKESILDETPYDTWKEFVQNKHSYEDPDVNNPAS